MKKNDEYRDILIIQTAFLGDVILTTPLIRATQELFPLADIDVLVIPETESVLANNPYIRHIYTFDKRSNKKAAFFSMIRHIRNHHYDLGITPHKSMTSAQLLWLGGVKRRIGFAGNAASLLYTDRIKFNPSKPQIGRNLDLLTIFTSRRFSSQTDIYFDKEIKAKAAIMLQPFQKYANRIAIAPGSVWATKRWPEGKYVELTARLKKHNVFLVFLGSADERELCQRIIDASHITQAINLAGKASLLEAAALTAACHLMICNDSGALHLANAVKTDVFAFFGPTVRSFGFAPSREYDRVFETEIDCRPCSTHGGNECPQKHFKCMHNISSERVYNAICEHLSL